MSSRVRQRWHDVAEKGTALGIQFLVVAATIFGRRAAGLVLRFVAAWYVLVHPAVRRASHSYLARAQGRATLGDVYRHVLCFARVALDRLFMVRGDFRPFRITTEGEEHLRSLRAANQGGLLLLAHLGSFEVLRALSERQDFPINVLGYFGNARRLNAALRKIRPDVDTRLIEIRPHDPSFIFEVEACVARGELVGTMGDRVGFDGKCVAVPFLGSPARFPTGPYLLAAALRCPVYLAFGLYHEPDRYHLVCEPFAERVELPRGARQEALAAYAGQYAARLEHYCRGAPHAWGNFYDFWSAS